MPSGQENEPELQITSADAWGGGRQAGFLQQLPSGNVARVRRGLDLPTMLSQGQIPNPLRGVVVQMIGTVDPTYISDKPSAKQEFDMKSLLSDETVLPQFMALLDRVTCQSMIEPKVSMPVPRGEMGDNPNETQAEYDIRINAWEPDPGSVSIFFISIEDKMMLFTLAQGVAADAKSFRAEQDATVPPASNGKSVRGTTKRTGGPAKRPAKKKAPAKKSAAKKSAARK